MAPNHPDALPTVPSTAGRTRCAPARGVPPPEGTPPGGGEHYALRTNTPKPWSVHNSSRTFWFYTSSVSVTQQQGATDTHHTSPPRCSSGSIQGHDQAGPQRTVRMRTDTGGTSRHNFVRATTQAPATTCTVGVTHESGVWGHMRGHIEHNDVV